MQKEGKILALQSYRRAFTGKEGGSNFRDADSKVTKSRANWRRQAEGRRADKSPKTFFRLPKKGTDSRLSSERCLYLNAWPDRIHFDN